MKTLKPTLFSLQILLLPSPSMTSYGTNESNPQSQNLQSFISSVTHDEIAPRCTYGVKTMIRTVKKKC